MLKIKFKSVKNLPFLPIRSHSLLDFTANVPFTPMTDKTRRDICDSAVTVIVERKLIYKIEQKINELLVAVIGAYSAAVLGVFIFFHAHIPYVLRNGAFLVGIIKIHTQSRLMTSPCNCFELMLKTLTQGKRSVIGNKIGHRNIEPFHTVRYGIVCALLAVKRHKAFHRISVSGLILKLRRSESREISADQSKAKRQNIKPCKYFKNKIHIHPPFLNIIQFFKRQVNIHYKFYLS